MNRNLIFLSAGLLATSPAEPAQALPGAPLAAPTTGGCLVASNLVAKGATNPNDRALAQSSLYFFLGRIGDHTTSQQLKSDLEQQRHVITRASLVPLMNACIHIMQTKSQILQLAAQQLQQKK